MSNETQTFTEVRARLEEIVGQVRSKDISLEKSLDLFDEAIRLGNNCFELIDRVDFSPEEVAASATEDSAPAPVEGAVSPVGDEETDEASSEGDAQL